ncbi:hypothetical protein CDAR_232321 [Caerostris darwini]|uniref:Uncharacterized protein n=1 Tax=Caerostris darwini TaxID=1538125 RepID=A0AAV4W7T4_9ARAC|nr:hypothetical protein CDAR_232321 [Caerostris darwini]
MTNVPEVSCVLRSAPKIDHSGGEVTRLRHLSNVNLAMGPSCRMGIINDATSRICADKSSEPLIGYLVNSVSRHWRFRKQEDFAANWGKRCQYFVALKTMENRASIIPCPVTPNYRLLYDECPRSVLCPSISPEDRSFRWESDKSVPFVKCKSRGWSFLSEGA